MPELRNRDLPFPLSLASDEEFRHIIRHERHAGVRCAHSIEFWVAVATRIPDGPRIVMQWCMRCQAYEVLTWEAYRYRKNRSDAHVYDDEDSWEPESL